MVLRLLHTSFLLLLFSKKTLFKLFHPIKVNYYQTIRSNSKVSYTYFCLCGQL